MLKASFVIAITWALLTNNALTDSMEELVVIATHDTRNVGVNSAMAISPDAAQLLKDAPGASVNGNGPLG